MTGIELHRHLMASGKTIPTILITAYPDDSARERALGDGVVCYLSKPFDESDVLALHPLVARYLTGARERR
jgi:CheY-like chemotaxis protein